VAVTYLFVVSPCVAVHGRGWSGSKTCFCWLTRWRV